MPLSLKCRPGVTFTQLLPALALKEGCFDFFLPYYLELNSSKITKAGLRLGKHRDSWENKTDCFPKGPVIKCIISHESRNSLWSPCRQHNLCDICVGPDGKALCDVMDCILIYSYTKRNHCDCEQGLLLPRYFHQLI